MARSERPRTLIELLGNLFGKNVIGHWDRVLQLAFLMVVPVLVLAALGATVATAIFYLRLDPTRWAAVAGCATLFVTAATARRRITQARKSKRRAKARTAARNG